MLETARRESRTRVRVQTHGYRWGIVDAILGVIMLPFGIWFMLIENMVSAIASLEALDLRRRH